MFDEFVEGVLQLHESAAEPLDLFVAETARLHAPQRLALDDLADHLEQRDHEPAQAPADVLAAAAQPARGGSGAHQPTVPARSPAGCTAVRSRRRSSRTRSMPARQITTSPPTKAPR